MSCNIAQVIRHWAVAEPHRLALVTLSADGESRRELSYGELELRVRRAVARLRAYGLGVGDRIALSAPNELAYLDAWFGALYAGCTVLPVPPMSSPAELAQRVQHARCKALVSSAPQLARGGLAQQALAHCPGVLAIDASSLVGARPESDASTAAHDDPSLDAPEPMRPESIAMLLYTYGTTGTAKGAMISHASLGLHTAALVHHVLRLGKDDRVLAALPLTHSYGIRMTLLAPFYAGACSVLLERFRPERVRAALADEQITWFPGVPTMFHALAHEPDAAGQVRFAGPGGHLRWCLSAGAPLPREVRLRAEAKLGVPLRQGFGLTEATFSSIATPDDPEGADTVGRPVFGVELRIIDEQGRTLATGEAGEVCVRGANVMSGYLDDAAATAEALRDGWLHSGDIGKLDSAGRLTIVDRIKDMVIRGGFNVYPAEVEAVLVTHPAVRDAVVVGVPDERYGEEVLAALVLHEGAALALDEFAGFCRAALSRVKLPRLLTRLTELPIGASGKVMRREVRRRALAGELTLEPVPAGPAQPTAHSDPH